MNPPVNPGHVISVPEAFLIMIGIPIVLALLFRRHLRRRHTPLGYAFFAIVVIGMLIWNGIHGTSTSTSTSKSTPTPSLGWDVDPTGDLAAARLVHAKWSTALSLHHWDEAREYMIPGHETDAEINDYMNRNTPIKDNGPVDKIADKLHGKLDGDVAYLAYKINTPPIFKMVKQNGKWLVDENHIIWHSLR
jgi:hypothetical protein